MRIRTVVLLIASGLAFAGLVVLPARAQSGGGNESSPSANIYTWNNNTPEWNRKLHVSGNRIGCSPGNQGVMDCLAKIQHELDEGQDVGKISISILNSGEDPSQAEADALFASQLSNSKSFLAEVSFDDFMDYYHQLFAPPRPGFSPQSWIEKMVENIKAKNPALRIGITVYTKQLHSDYAYIRPPDLPLKVAASINTVYLYPSYEDDSKPSRYPAYVQQAKALFPNAEIVGGSPAYDHVDWGFCSDFGARRYTPTQEVRLYEELIAIQARLLKSGVLSGIEFYPGHFGKESEWGGWKIKCVCHSNRVQQCVEDTRKMREYAEKTLQSTLGW